MQKRFAKSLLSVAMLGGLSAALTWSNDSHACAVEPYLSAVCTMAMIQTDFRGFVPADGRILNVNANQALYSLVGNTYGGTTNTTFGIPDLRGRVVVGAGTVTGRTSYQVGATGGATTPTLALAISNLPSHAHAVTSGTNGSVTVTTDKGTLAATTTMAGLTATTTLGSVTGTVNGSNLTLQANSGNGGGSSPAGTSLATVNVPSAKLYSTSAPNVAMMAGSIAGTASVAFTGTPATTITGSPTTTLQGAPTVTLSGGTAAIGSAQPITIMPAYQALNYFVAIEGIYPMRN